MVSTITTRQNEQQCLDLLFTQRSLYSSAKKYFEWRSFFAILFAILGPIITLKNNDFSSFVGVISIFYLVFDNLCLERLENYKKETAAKIQELFDTKVLELSWNDIVSGSKPDPEAMASVLSKSPMRDYSPLKNWYATSVDKVPVSLGRLLCQRSNLWWDTQLRKKYVTFLSIFLLLVLLSTTVFGLFFDLTIAQLILGILLPILPLIELLLKQIINHHRTVSSILSLKGKLDILIESIFRSSAPENLTELSRTFQDEIFRHRQRCPLIFDALYWIFRNGQEAQMQFSIENKVNEYLRLT